MQIRYYQENAVLALWNYFTKSTGNPLVAMPTGTGKSVVIAEWLRSVFTYTHGQRVMMLTHVKELIQQNYKKLVEVWPMAPVGIYSAGLKRKEVRPITFAGIASVIGKAELFGHIDMVIIDESHLVSPKEETSYQNFIADLKLINPLLKVIGLTATPYRLGQGLLIHPVETKKGPRPSLFTDICFDLTSMGEFNRLIDEGFICPLVPKRTDEKLEVDNVRTTLGEYNIAELQAAVDKLAVTRRAIDETLKHAFADERPRVKWLVFASGVEHSDHIAEELVSRGIAARSVHSKSTDKYRDDAIEWFKEETDEVRAIVNNGVLTTGFDCPEIDLIVVLRPTQSPGLWVQMLGRGTRPAPWVGKRNCLVLDFAGNSKRLGPINDPVLPRRKGKPGAGEAPIKVCESCGTYNHASMRFCTCCGQRFEERVKILASAGTTELIRGSEPKYEVFPVDKVTYGKFISKQECKPPSLRVVYHCGKFQKFSEWVCLEHGGYVSGKARDWWKRGTIHAELAAPPSTIDAAILRLDTLRTPTHIKVWINGAHPQVMDRDFSGQGWPEKPGKTGKLTVAETFAT